ncbi:PAS domain S-box protein [Anaeromyxobacter oryzisoli]|uniref:PAS domain S-box protein n=1 Tax=Anaeromyxobacter oryzisoli TaxID=2925408 RepID=UPI001F58EED6|nr:PAS domain S-box protein [Anaeromyxobacter sp. SG63]
MTASSLRIASPSDLAPLGDALAALGIGITLVDRELRVQLANAFVREQASELSCGADHCFAALWHRSQRCADCLPLLVFRTGEAQEGVRERGRPGERPEAWRVRAVPVEDASGRLAWVAETFLRLNALVPDLAGRAPAEAGSTAHLVVDREERIVSWSPGAAAMLGWTVEEVLGRRVALLIPEDRADEERALAARVVAEGRAPRLETVRRARDGRLVPVAITAVALRGEAGELVGRTCAIEDLSALHQLRGRVLRQEQLLAHISREAADAIVAVDLDGKVTSWNRGAEQLLGRAAAEMVGQPLARVAPAEPLARLLERAARGRPVRGVRLEWHDARGEPVPVDVSAAVLGGAGSPSGVALVARDVSAQARLDRQLVRSEKLAMVGSLAAGLAHEIGTPLNVISATAEYLLPDAAPDARGKLEGIVAETERISRLVRDLLSFARGGRTGRIAVPLAGALDRVRSLLRITLDRRRVRLEAELPVDLPAVDADPDGLHQVLLNLLVNAAQAVAEGGRIGVRAQTIEQEGERMVRMEVYDDGPGVPPALRERIFDPFFTTRAEGTGLGLAVCARIVAEHGGDLRVGDGPLGGAAFVVQLPAAAEVA